MSASDVTPDAVGDPAPLLELDGVSKVYGPPDTGLVALHDFSLTLPKSPASIVTVAGESGSGKSTLANLVLGFETPTRGRVRFDGRDVSTGTRAERKAYHRDVQAVFQDPFGVYNPFYRVGHVFDMVVRNYGLARRASDARERIEEGLNAVGLIGDDVLGKYPHQLSGGQRQRIMMARAYLLKPKLIVADEPVSMVDASLRASILDVMTTLRDENGISFLYITHDLSTAYQIGDRIILFYQGTVAETGPATEVISRPRHPYVRLLVDSVPKPDPAARWEGTVELPVEEELRTAASTGCRFGPRCPERMPRCAQALPPLIPVGGPDHRASCYLYDRTSAHDRHDASAAVPTPMSRIDAPGGAGDAN